MSQIAALLLMYLNSDEDAFWALNQLMVAPKYTMHGFFIPGFPKLIRFQDHLEKVVLMDGNMICCLKFVFFLTDPPEKVRNLEKTFDDPQHRYKNILTQMVSPMLS